MEFSNRPSAAADASLWLFVADRMADLHERHYITGPNENDVRNLAPQVSAREAERLLAEALVRPVNFVGPPMRVHGALHVYEIANYGSEGVRLRYAYSHRVRVSGTWRRGSPHERGLYAAAEEYACKHWPERLIRDSSAGVLHAMLIAPGQKSDDKARVVGGMVAYTDVGFPEALRLRHKPECEVIDDSITAADHWVMTCREMVGYHGVWAAYYCDACGGAVGEDRCLFCERPFASAADCGRPVWSSALPYKLASLAADVAGHEFAIDPVEARKADYALWARSDYRPPRLGTHRRVITLEDPPT